MTSQEPARSSGHVGYPALDGWRGICASLVALFHFRLVWHIDVNSHFARAAIVQNASLFVDFFFVLSGFVIAYRYQDRLIARTIRLRDFLALRLGRLYPLHLFTLMLMLGIAIFVRSETHDPTQVTWGSVDVGLVAFVANLLLVQGLHTLSSPTWNYPSWSISAEFATYLAYAVLWTQLRTRTWIATTVVIVTAPVVILVLNGDTLDVTYDWGFVRSMLGFALGTIAFSASRNARVQELFARLSPGESTVIEVLLLSLTYAVVTLAAGTPYSLAAPFLFAGVVLAFSEARGAVTAALVSRPLQSLGRFSYSIYMLHLPLQLMLIYASVALGASGWISLFGVHEGSQGPEVTLGRSPWVGDVATVIMFALLIAGSALTYRWIEQPWRARVRRWVAARRAQGGAMGA